MDDWNHENGTLNHENGTLNHINCTLNHENGTLNCENGTLNHGNGTLNHENGTLNHEKEHQKVENRDITSMKSTYLWIMCYCINSGKWHDKTEKSGNDKKGAQNVYQ